MVIDDLNQFEGGSGVGGGTNDAAPFGVTYGGKNYNVKYPIGSSTYVDIRDLCPVYKDLEHSTLDSRFKGLSNLSLEGTLKAGEWNETYTLPFRKSGYTSESWCVKGTVPQGKNCVAVITPTGWYSTLEDAQNKTNVKDGDLMKEYSNEQDYLECGLHYPSYSSSDEYLELEIHNKKKNTSKFIKIGPKKSNYKDGVLPKRLLIVLGGGGGRGGGYNSFLDGYGGASGASVAFIVEFNKFWQPIVFRIGKGATKTSDSSFIDDGQDTSMLFYGVDRDIYDYWKLAVAGGGHSSTNKSPGESGKGEIFNLSSDIYFKNKLWNVPSKINGVEKTSSVFEGRQASSIGEGSHPKTFIKTTTNENVPFDATNTNVLYPGAMSGGDGTYRGGGASLFAHGGDAGTSEGASGKDGHLGSGGGGGVRYVGKGGAGGDGYVAIYY